MGTRDAYEPEGISPARLAFDRRFRAGTVGSIDLVLRHWLLVANGVNALIVLGAVAAPLLAAAGLGGPAGGLFSAYSALCAQLPERSYFLLGQQMAMDQRMMAIYGESLVAGLVFIPLRGALHPLSLRAFLWMALPLALDGFTQLFGWRESNWVLRTVTGTAFGAGTVLFAYPRIDREVGSLLSSPHETSARLHEVN